MECERIFVACDVSNLFRSCRDVYGDSARVDFQILSAMIPAMEYPRTVNQKLMAYIVTDPKQRHHGFSNALCSYGFNVRERFMSREKAGDQLTRTDWDVGITIDAIDNIDNYDTFALVSGDGDFSILLDYMKVREKKTLVLSFEKCTARSLYAAADKHVMLTQSILFNSALK